jgi:quinol-cytochrome oxidoreductase complex cytochrome b subunit
MNKELNMMKYIFWIIGFIVLFMINLVVELYLLPLWGLDNTPKNDIYFKCWWIVVGVWFLFGMQLVRSAGRKKQILD